MYYNMWRTKAQVCFYFSAKMHDTLKLMCIIKETEITFLSAMHLIPKKSLYRLYLWLIRHGIVFYIREINKNTVECRNK